MAETEVAVHELEEEDEIGGDFLLQLLAMWPRRSSSLLQLLLLQLLDWMLLFLLLLLLLLMFMLLPASSRVPPTGFELKSKLADDERVVKPPAMPLPLPPPKT